MDLLDELLDDPTSYRPYRYRGPGYIPFSQPRYTGSIFAMPVGRYNDFISNALYYRAFFNSETNALPRQASVNLSTIEDRRLWRPSQDISLNVYGQQVTPVDISIFSPEWYETRPSKPPIGEPKSRPFEPNPYPELPDRIPDWLNPRSKLRRGFMTDLKNAPWWYGFRHPDKVVICIKRKIRSEVLHALGITGKVGQNPPHFNAYSRVKC